MSEAKRQKTAHDAPDNESLKADSTSTTPATMAKKLCIGGNWKCNGTKSKASALKICDPPSLIRFAPTGRFSCQDAQRSWQVPCTFQM